MDGKTIQKVQKNYIYFTDGSVYYDFFIEEWNTENEIDEEELSNIDKEEIIKKIEELSKIDEEEIIKKIERFFQEIDEEELSKKNINQEIIIDEEELSNIDEDEFIKKIEGLNLENQKKLEHLENLENQKNLEYRKNQENEEKQKKIKTNYLKCCIPKCNNKMMNDEYCKKHYIEYVGEIIITTEKCNGDKKCKNKLFLDNLCKKHHKLLNEIV